MSVNETLPEALTYAAKGYRLGPVTVRQDARGTKTPVFHTAWSQPDGTSSDPDQLVAWSMRYPGCSFHAPTGPNEIVVADLDGEDGTQAWYRAGGPRSPMTVTTRSGGRHLYFRAPADPIGNSVGIVLPHVDVRGGPAHRSGTVFISGTVVHGLAASPYVAHRILAPAELPELPTDWAERLRDAGPPTTPKRRPRTHRLHPPQRKRAAPDSRPHSREWIEAKARDELRQPRRGARANFSEQLYTAALAGYRAVRAGVLDLSEVDAALAEALALRGVHAPTLADLDPVHRAYRDAAARPWEVTA